MGLGDDSPVSPDNRARRQGKLAPPDHVGQVAERADHRDAGAFVGLGERMRVDSDLDIEQRRADGLAEERCVTSIVRVGDKPDARRNQLGSRRLDDDVAVRTVERHRVVRTWSLAVFKFSLCDCSAEVDVPQGRCFLRVSLAPCEVVKERTLRCATSVLRNRRVEQRPIDGQTEAAEEIFEDLLVLSGQFVTQLDEVGS